MQAFTRSDGLWEIEARLTDVKTHDLVLPPGTREGGVPLHDFWIRIAFDHRFTIVAAEAGGDWVPYPGACEEALPDYASLKGLNLSRGFRQAVIGRFGSERACTHLTELVTVLPTVAMQAFGAEAERLARAPEAASDGTSAADSANGTREPFFIGRCRAMRRDGDAVRQYYPQWFRARKDISAQ